MDKFKVFWLSLMLAVSTLACGGLSYEEEATIEEADEHSDVRWVPVEPEDVTQEQWDEIGQLQQGLVAATLPSGYGSQQSPADGNKGYRCTSGVTQQCGVPSKKNFKVHFIGGTCDAWWQARVIVAWNTVKAKINSLGGGWSFTDSGSESSYMNVKCGDAGSNNLGLTVIPYLNVNEVDVNGFDPRYGLSATVFIDSAQVNGWSCFQTASEASRRNAAENLIMHEMYHGFGFGHMNDTTNIMNVSLGCPGATPLHWSSHRLLTSSQTTVISGYTMQ